MADQASSKASGNPVSKIFSPPAPISKPGTFQNIPGRGVQANFLKSGKGSGTGGSGSSGGGAEAVARGRALDRGPQSSPNPELNTPAPTPAELNEITQATKNALGTTVKSTGVPLSETAGSDFSAFQQQQMKDLAARNTPNRVVSFIKGLSERAPTEYAPIDLTRPVIPQQNLEITTPDIISESRPAPGLPSGSGTQVITQREKTFFEKNNLPMNKDTIVLKEKLESVRGRLGAGIINKYAAEKQIDDALNEYNKAQIVKNIPKDVVIAAGLGVVTAVLPEIGIPIDLALGTQLFLQREAIAKQVINAPAQSALQIGATLTAGLTGAAIGGRIGGISRFDLKAADIDNIRFLSNDRIKQLATAVQSNDPQFKAIVNQGKVTNTIAYDIALRDGRQFTILEFNKQTGVGNMVGQKGFYGFERVKSGEGMKIYGTSAARTTAEGAEEFLKVYRLKPLDVRAAKVFEKVGAKSAGEELTILTKENIIGTRGNIKRSFTSIEGQTKILSMKPLGKTLLDKIKVIQRKIDVEQKIPLAEIKNLVNLERRLNGEAPFTEAQWRSAKDLQLTRSDVLTLLDKAKASARVATQGDLNIGVVRAEAKSTSFGRGTVRPGKEVVKAKRELSMVEKVKKFRETSSMSEFSNRVVKNNPSGEKPRQTPSLKKEFKDLRGKTSMKQLEKNIVNLRSRPSLGITAALGKTVKAESRAGKGLRVLPTKRLHEIAKPSMGSFAGKGTYEKTGEVAFAKLAGVTKTNTVAPSKLGERKSEFERQRAPAMLKPKERSSEFKRIAVKVAPAIQAAERQAVSQQVKLKSPQVQLDRSRSKTEVAESPRLKSDLRKIVKPKLQPRPLIPRGEKESKKQEFNDLRSRKGFAPVVRERGKFVRVSGKSFKTKEEALGAGFVRATGVLGRSVTVVRTVGEPTLKSTAARAAFNRLSNEFRSSKQFGPQVRVQKNALFTKAEIKLIQKARQAAKPFAKRGAPKIMSIK